MLKSLIISHNSKVVQYSAFDTNHRIVYAIINREEDFVMTYEEIVDRVREDYENADARAIFEHIAVQFNIEGEGSGIFYIEVADRKGCVEPYDYYDKDALVVISSETLMALSKGTMTTEEALEKGLMKLSGNREKLKMLRKIVFKRKIFW